jgi:hypothetical protein
MGVAGPGDTALPASLSSGVLRGCQARVPHQLSGRSEARDVPEFRHGRHRDGKLDAPRGLEGIDHWTKAPGLHLVVKFLLEPLEALGLLDNSPDVLLKDDLLRRGGTDHRGEPTQVGGAPGGPARIADIVPQEKGFSDRLLGTSNPT